MRDLDDEIYDENAYEELKIVNEFERKHGKIKVENNIKINKRLEKEYCDDEILSGDDIETLDDLEVWNRFIN